MDVTFGSAALAELCNSERAARSALGTAGRADGRTAPSRPGRGGRGGRLPPARGARQHQRERRDHHHLRARNRYPRGHQRPGRRRRRARRCRPHPDHQRARAWERAAMSETESHPFRPDYLIPPGRNPARPARGDEPVASGAGGARRPVRQAREPDRQGHGADHLGDRDRAGTDHRDPGERVEPQRSRLPGRAAPRQAARAVRRGRDGGCRRCRSRSCKAGARCRPRRDPGRLFDAALSFFGVADHAAWERIWRGPVASFRRSHAYTSDPGAVVSWLRIAQIEAQQTEAGAVLSAAVPQGLAGDPLSDARTATPTASSGCAPRRASSSCSSPRSRAAGSAAPRGGQPPRVR